MPDLEKDILKVTVVERHKSTGNIGLGFVKGFGIKRGRLLAVVLVTTPTTSPSSGPTTTILHMLFQL